MQTSRPRNRLPVCTYSISPASNSGMNVRVSVEVDRPSLWATTPCWTGSPDVNSLQQYVLRHGQPSID